MEFFFPYKYITPNLIDKRNPTKINLPEENIYTYRGIKEEFYISHYKPDVNFMNEIPFRKYVLLRGENYKAAYVKGKNKSILFEIVNILSKSDINIIFLPRYKEQKNLFRKFSNVFVPQNSLNGLDACFILKQL